MKTTKDLNEFLQNPSEYKFLDLSRKTVTDEDCQKIAEILLTNDSLKRLWFDGATLSDTGAVIIVEALQSNNLCPIEQLSFRGTEVTDRLAQAIGEYLKVNNTSLSDLWLDNTSICDDGVILIAEGLKGHLTLKNLYLHNTKVSGVGFAALGDALSKNVSLSGMTLNNTEVDDDGAERFAEGLKENDSLEILWFDHSQIGDVCAERISYALKHDNHSLKDLSFVDTQVGNAGVKSICGVLSLTSLSKLWLDGTRIGNGAATTIAEALMDNPPLSELYLNNTRMSDIGAIKIVAALLHNVRLKKLHLNDMPLTDQVAIASADALLSNSSLEELGIGNSSIGDAGVRKIAEALPYNTGLKKLYLHGTSINDETAKLIAKGLAANHVLEELKINNTLIGDSGVESVVDIWKISSSFSNLSLNMNQISKGMIEKVANVINKPKSSRIEDGLNELDAIKSRYQNDKEHLVKVLVNMANFCMEYKKLQGALKCFQEIVLVKEMLYGFASPKLIDDLEKMVKLSKEIDEKDVAQQIQKRINVLRSQYSDDQVVSISDTVTDSFFHLQSEDTGLESAGIESLDDTASLANSVLGDNFSSCAVSVDSNQSDSTRQEKAKCYATIGDICKKEGNIKGAVHNYKKAVRLDKSLKSVYIKLVGSLSESLHEYEEAIGCYTEVHDSDSVARCYKKLQGSGNVNLSVAKAVAGYFVACLDGDNGEIAANGSFDNVTVNSDQGFCQVIGDDAVTEFQ